MKYGLLPKCGFHHQSVPEDDILKQFWSVPGFLIDRLMRGHSSGQKPIVRLATACKLLPCDVKTNLVLDWLSLCSTCMTTTNLSPLQKSMPSIVMSLLFAFYRHDSWWKFEVNRRKSSTAQYQSTPLKRAPKPNVRINSLLFASQQRQHRNLAQEVERYRRAKSAGSLSEVESGRLRIKISPGEYLRLEVRVMQDSWACGDMQRVVLGRCRNTPTTVNHSSGRWPKKAPGSRRKTWAHHNQETRLGNTATVDYPLWPY